MLSSLDNKSERTCIIIRIKGIDQNRFAVRYRNLLVVRHGEPKHPIQSILGLPINMWYIRIIISPSNTNNHITNPVKHL